MSVCAISITEAVRPADDPFVLGLVTIDARTGALDADMGFLRFCHGSNSARPLNNVDDLLQMVVPEERLTVQTRMLGAEPGARDLTCRLQGALGGPATIRFIVSRRTEAEASNGTATYVAVMMPEPTATASPLERIALLLIEAEGLARGIGNSLLSKLIRAVLLQVGLDAGHGLMGLRGAANDTAKH